RRPARPHRAGRLSRHALPASRDRSGSVRTRQPVHGGLTMDAFREQIQTLTCKAGLLPPGCDVVKVSDIGALASAPPSAPVGPYTYASTQATTCAGCGEHKHTPLRIDAMGGYVCLTCIDQKLGGLLGEFGYP